MTTVRHIWEMACPQCQSDEGIEIAMTVWGALTIDGTDTDGGENEWTPNSRSKCTDSGIHYV